jgi:predicted nucleotidyltransferase
MYQSELNSKYERYLKHLIWTMKDTVEHQYFSWYVNYMVNEEEIEKVATRVGKEINAYQVILFGSYARGQASEDSDVDLMVVAESELPRFKRSRELYKLFRPYPFGMDLIVYTPEEIEKGKKSPISFVSRILREGKTVYVRGN